MKTIVVENLKKIFSETEDKNELANYLKWIIHELCENPNPVDNVQWIPLEKVQANDYNPNSVAWSEMKLLYTSIKEDWYTQPIVVIYDEEIDKYIIIDWFHRHLTLKYNKDLQEINNNCLPCVVLKKDINQRMASTVRHNRARWSHSVDWMSNMVFQMLDNWMSDDEVCNKLWLEVDELLRLKHITGFAKLFENTEYKKAWEDKKQLMIKKKYKEENPI